MTMTTLSLTDDERTMVCSCLIGWLTAPHNERVERIVLSALRKLEGCDKIVRIDVASGGEE